MPDHIERLRFTLSTFGLIGVAAVTLQIAHELAHWLACRMLGYVCFLGLNSSGALSASTAHWHGPVIDLAGPLLTVLAACAFTYLIVKRGQTALYPFLLFCFAMRLLASIFGVIFMHNDEARLSLWLGWAPQVLPLLVCLFLFWLVYHAAREARAGLRYNCLAMLAIYTYVALIIAVDVKTHLRLI
ncbi:MAG: hypothetical protein V4582_25485 [Pseudomonadota bacterium]